MRSSLTPSTKNRDACSTTPTKFPSSRSKSSVSERCRCSCKEHSMSKADRILEFFPSYCGADDRTQLLHEVTRNLAAPVEEADTLLLRIQRAHRIKVAEHADDIVLLAGALTLTSFHFAAISHDEH